MIDCKVISKKLQCYQHKNSFIGEIKYNWLIEEVCK